MSLKFSIIYLISSLFLIVNNLFASHVTVVDGDTIKLGDVKIRFSGIDAPEINQTCVASEGKVACGKISKDILTEGLPLGAIQITGSSDSIISFVDHQTTGGYPVIGM